MQKTVTILLSTYNGANYLHQQIESLLNQKMVKLNIIVRDDGSKDKTTSIIENFKKKYKFIDLYREENIGAESSFNRLCEIAINYPPTDYYAFCDQDDVWLPDKLNFATEKLLEFDNDKPNLYFSNLLMVDENLNVIRNFYDSNEVDCEKDHTLLQIFSYGCTCVFNRTALEYYTESCTKEIPHDNWIYVICSYFGRVYYDSRCPILYRQHNNNLSEYRNSGFKLFVERLLRLLRGKIVSSFQPIAKNLLQNYHKQLSIQDIDFITHIAQYDTKIRSKLYLIFSRRYKSKSLTKNIGIIIRIITNRL